MRASAIKDPSRRSCGISTSWAWQYPHYSVDPDTSPPRSAPSPAPLVAAVGVPTLFRLQPAGAYGRLFRGRLHHRGLESSAGSLRPPNPPFSGHPTVMSRAYRRAPCGYQHRTVAPVASDPVEGLVVADSGVRLQYYCERQLGGRYRPKAAVLIDGPAPPGTPRRISPGGAPARTRTASPS